MSESLRSGLLITGSQLFPPNLLPDDAGPIFMCEDVGLCTYVKHHQQKLVLFLAAMREYADELTGRDFDVTYRQLDPASGESYEDRLEAFVAANELQKLVCFELEDHFFAERISDFCEAHDLKLETLRSPMFMSSRDDFAGYLDSVKKPFMADFYKRQRKSFGLMMDADGKPRGGQWSFDQDNRKKLPAKLEIPAMPETAWTEHTADVVALVKEHFADHPGSADDFWWPVTRRSALVWVNRFIEDRLRDFGRYQDALSKRSDTVFHGVISPMMNLGLITPAEVLERVLEKADRDDIPLNSLEGFVRQVIGWREFIRGVYHHFDQEQRERNFWNHQRSLTDAWFTGDTGIEPLDHAIDTVNKLGWSHHIVRLMVVGNLMNLCEIEPRQVHDWFMVTHVDSADWVMGPNVYGMALFSDGGVFATKPYICGSNYLLKMSDYSRGPWCDVVDGLYWRFVDRHRIFFAGNHRLSMMVKTLDRMKSERRDGIFAAAEQFLNDYTA